MALLLLKGRRECFGTLKWEEEEFFYNSQPPPLRINPLMWDLKLGQNQHFLATLSFNKHIVGFKHQ